MNTHQLKTFRNRLLCITVIWVSFVVNGLVKTDAYGLRFVYVIFAARGIVALPLQWWSVIRQVRQRRKT